MSLCVVRLNPEKPYDLNTSNNIKTSITRYTITYLQIPLLSLYRGSILQLAGSNLGSFEGNQAWESPVHRDLKGNLE